VRYLAVDAGSDGQRLDNFLAKVAKGVPKTHLYRVIRSGEVRVNSARADADVRLREGDTVRLPPLRTAVRADDAPAPPREFPVVFEDAHLLAIDKPAGVAVHGGSGTSFGVIEQLRRAREGRAPFLELVHRLDKETSGLLLVAKTRKALVALQDDLRSRAPERAFGKTYAALVAGAWPAKTKVIDVALEKTLRADGTRHVRPVSGDAAESGRAKRSITLVRVAEALPGCTLLDVTLKTGRTHQIRVHLAQAGHPIAGDPAYGDFALNRALQRGTSPLAPGHRLDRMFLHALALTFRHPATGEPVALAAPLPEACEAFLAAVRGEPA
jgi:23S rRNA pseudouridine955/2504/2580 synthase